jgi:hypothetical protein
MTAIDHEHKSRFTNNRINPVAAGLGVLLYTLWNARDLVALWVHSQNARCDSVAFVLWLAPIASLWVARPAATRAAVDHSSALVFSIALGLSCAGVMTDVAILKDLGFAVALAGFLPFRRCAWIWLIIAATWMPASGWAFEAHNPALVNSARIVVACLSVALFPFLIPAEPIE